MNILFIYSLKDARSLTKPLRRQWDMQLGISYISSFLKKQSHHTKLLVLTKKTEYTAIDGCIKEFNPKLICFTAVTTEYPFIAEIASYIKSRYSSIFLLAGGVHVSLNPEEAISDDFDALCIGEGEEPTLELAEQLEKGIRPSGIANLWIKRSTRIEKNPPRPFLQDLNSLPFPDREMWQELILNMETAHSILLGKGCPFPCTYCCNHALRKLAPGPYVRFRSPNNIVDEIRKVADRFKSEEINFEVESIALDKKWAIELCEKLERFNATRNKALSFGANIRITAHTELEDLFAALKRANFRIIYIGLESGSERIRHEVLRRDYSNKDIIEAVRLTRKYGLQVRFYNLIGIPGETLYDFKKTVEMNRICLPDSQLLSIFYPYPGTDLYSLCKQQGLLQEPLATEWERKKAVLDLPSFSKKQIQKQYLWFNYHVYKGHRPYAVLVRDLFSRYLFVYGLVEAYDKNRFNFFGKLKNGVISLLKLLGM